MRPARQPLRLAAATVAAALLVVSAGPAMANSPSDNPETGSSDARGSGHRPAIPGARLEPRPYQAIPGWDRDDHAEAYRVFLRTCERAAPGSADLRPGLPMPAPLAAACRAALQLGSLDATSARAFFERWFEPLAVLPEGDGRGFLTGYYEPEIAGVLAPDAGHPEPALGRPADLVSPGPETANEAWPAGLAAARRTPGGLAAYPDRAAIWDGALAGQGLELLWLPDRVELFLAQVQGSARVRLPDGSLKRLVYAGRNGQPYTSIGKVIVSEGHMRLEDMTLASLKAWLRAHPGDAERIMRLNRSYIFFALGDHLDPDEGPIGAAAVPLTPLRSIAVDRTVWPYGLPVWIEAELPFDGEGTSRPFARLMVAQDTGSAIVGPARADLFTGSGAAAGDLAGNIRHTLGFTVLWPRAEPAP